MSGAKWGKSQEKTLRMMSAAESEFARVGFSAASLEIIAAQAAVSRQLIYNRYGGKRGLFDAVQGSARNALLDMLVDDTRFQSSPLEAIAGQLKVLFDGYSASALSGRSVMDDGFLSCATEGPGDEPHRIYAIIERHLAQGRQSGEIRRDWNGRTFFDAAASLIVGIAAMGKGPAGVRDVTVDFIMRALTAAEEIGGPHDFLQPNHIRTMDVTNVERIISAAEAEFAQSGVQSSSIFAIAARAQVSKQLVYYYFKDKRTLYKAVHDRLVDRVLRHFEALDLEGMTPLEALRSYVVTYEQVQAAYPNSMKLDLFNRLQRGAIEAGDAFGRKRTNAFLKRFQRAIQRGYEEGSIHPSITATLLFNLSAIIFCSSRVGIDDRQFSSGEANALSNRRSIAREFIICGSRAQG